MNPIYHARKKRQLRYLVKRLKGLLKENQSVTQLKIESLVKKIRSLVKELTGVLAPVYLKKILGSAALILGVTFSSQVTAQSFASPQQNPFGLVSVSDSPTPHAFADLDNDGDMDLLVGRPNYYGPSEVQYFENIGSPSNPQFTSPQTNPFGIDPEFDTYIFPAIADMDGDGDLDLLAIGYDDIDDYVFKYFENTGTATSPQFATAVDNPFGVNPNNEDIAIPTLVDLDGDGDTDILSVDYYGDIFYFENTGSPTAAQFGSPVTNPFGLGTTEYYVFPAFADLDDDGDLDLLGGAESAIFQYFENTGSATNPQFALPVENPFDLVATNYYAVPAFADLDNDGDMDLLVAEDYGNFQYFENISAVGVHEEYVNIPLELFPNPVIDVLSINTDTPFEKIEIYDATGRLLNTYDGSVNSINVNEWAPGMYLLKFVDEQGQFTSRKILKE